MCIYICMITIMVYNIVKHSLTVPAVNKYIISAYNNTIVIQHLLIVYILIINVKQAGKIVQCYHLHFCKVIKVFCYFEYFCDKFYHQKEKKNTCQTRCLSKCCTEVRLYLQIISSGVWQQFPSAQHNEKTLTKSKAVPPEGKANQINHLFFNPTGNHCVREQRKLYL